MRWRRRLVRALIAVAVLLVITAAGWPVYVHPRTDTVGAGDSAGPAGAVPGDAVLALGGLAYSAVYAEQLHEQGLASRAVISNPYQPADPAVEEICRKQAVTCFEPDPSTTRGEAQELGRLARAYGWDDVIVVAPTWHISRARLIVGRCFTGRLRVVDPGISANRWDWPALYVYQTAGFAKAAVLRGC